MTYKTAFIKQLDSTYDLFHKRCQVIVPRFASDTAEGFKLYGVIYNTGMTPAERDAFNRERVMIWAAPVRHILMFGDGVPISYPTREQAMSVYTMIKNHLKTWSSLSTGSLNARKDTPPVEDFDLMYEYLTNLEQFLEYWYNKGRADHHFVRQTTNRFIRESKHHHKQDSLYSKATAGEFGLATGRVAREGDIVPVGHSPVSERFRDDEFHGIDFTSSIREVRNGS